MMKSETTCSAVLRTFCWSNSAFCDKSEDQMIAELNYLIELLNSMDTGPGLTDHITKLIFFKAMLVRNIRIEWRHMNGRGILWLEGHVCFTIVAVLRSHYYRHRLNTQTISRNNILDSLIRQFWIYNSIGVVNWSSVQQKSYKEGS